MMNLPNLPYLTLLLLTPVVGLVLILLTPEKYSQGIKRIALAASSFMLFLSLLLCIAYDQSSGGFQFIEFYSWIPSVGITYCLGVDGLNLPMVLLASLVMFSGVLTSWELQSRVKEFFASLLFLILGVVGVFLTLDLFFLFLFYEIAILPMYLLILIWGSTKKEYSAMKLTLFLFLGSAFVFVGFLAIAKVSGAGFNILDISGHPFDKTFQSIIFLFLLIGFGSLMAVFPLHTWSPDGYAAAPTAASMLHAGVLKKLGAYGLLRVGILLLPEGAREWAVWMAVLGVVNILYGGYCALHQKDLKYMIGYLCISHMGIVLLGFSTLTQAGINGAVFQMFAHGCMTALFFSATGFISDRMKTRMIPDLSGIAKVLPVGATFLVLGALASIGLPGFAIFNAELMVFITTIQIYPVLGILAVTGIVLTAFYVLRSLQYAVFGPERVIQGEIKDVSLLLSIPRITLIGALVLFGFFPNLLLNLIRSTTGTLFTGV